MFSVVFLFLVLVYYSEADIELSKSTMIVRRVKSLKCRSEVNLSRYSGKMVAYHQWNQVYPEGNDRFVSNLRAIESFNSEYTVELQKFDHNTNIYSSVNVYNASNGFQHVFNVIIHCSGVQRKIILVDDDIYHYQVDHMLTYADSENVKFDCLQYLHLADSIQIGWITAGNRILTYNQTEILMKLTDVHNGSMLCCLYYTTSAYKNRKNVQRFVKDKILLIYQKEMPNNGGQPSSTTKSESNRNITATSTLTQFITDTSNATGKNLKTINETGQTIGITNVTGQITGITNETGQTTGIKNDVPTHSGAKNGTGQKSNAPNTTDKNTYTTNGTDSSDHNAVADTNNYVIIIISSITGIILLLLVGICAIKKRCWKKTDRPGRPQLPLPQIPGTRLRPSNNNEADSNTPFYLNLLFRRECEQEIQAQEEPHYEEVMYQ